MYSNNKVNTPKRGEKCDIRSKRVTERPKAWEAVSPAAKEIEDIKGQVPVSPGQWLIAGNDFALTDI